MTSNLIFVMRAIFINILNEYLNDKKETTVKNAKCLLYKNSKAFCTKTLLYKN